MSQANGAAIHSKFPGLCQHEIVSGTLEERKQCGVVQASTGCLQARDLPAGKSCVHGRPYLSFRPITLRHFILSLDKYADGCRI